MRLRTKLFLTWAAIMPLLWAPAFVLIERTVQGRLDRQISADIGAGGPTIRVRTHNGGVRVMKK